jgi:hypothetical protein
MLSNDREWKGDKRIISVKGVHRGDLVTSGGVVAKIVGFKNRKTVFLKNIVWSSKEWDEVEVSVKSVKKLLPLASVEWEEGAPLVELLVHAIDSGLRDIGLGAKCFLGDDRCTIDIKILGERPQTCATLVFRKNEV